MARLSVPMKDNQRFNNTTPAHELVDFRTPHEKFFVVHHLGIPDMDAAPWRLVVDGCVNRALELALTDLAALPQVEVEAVHECAGSPLRPTVPVRRAGNVIWGGVRLKEVLRRAGIQDGAAFVWARGADSGVYPPTGYASDSYLKDVPLHKALSDEVLLATTLNGAPLDERHGAPVRLVVPGYYGTNSVKWLTQLRLETSRAGGYFTTELYNDTVVEHGVETRRPVWALAPQSIIVAPAADSRVAGAACRGWGWAWSAAAIASVEVSVDGGSEWRHATVDAREGLCWQRFTFDWTPRAKGPQQLACRATDAHGNVQPDDGARNAVHRVQVTVE
jgi:DMSO/TMAO reductase YedYZ molybdopterin-dependent catalytic subunit